jgi:hypothetical protein
MDLYSGHIGQALAGLYIAYHSDDEGAFEQYFGVLSHSIEAIYAGQYPQMMNATLAHGITGLGCALGALMDDGLIENDLASLLLDIDAFVARGAAQYLRQGNTDYLRGGLGGLWYLRGRLAQNNQALASVKELTALLLKNTIKNATQIHFTNQANRMPQPLSIAHGNVGVGLVLLDMYEKGIMRTPKVRATIMALAEGIEADVEDLNPTDVIGWNSPRWNVAHFFHRLQTIFPEVGRTPLLFPTPIVEKGTSKGIYEGWAGTLLYWQFLGERFGLPSCSTAYQNDVPSQVIGNEGGLFEGEVGLSLARFASQPENSWKRLFLMR